MRRSRPAWVTRSSPPEQRAGFVCKQLPSAAARQNLTRGLTCYDVHAVSFGALFDDLVARFEAGDRQEIHHHGRLLIVEAAQEVIFLDGFHNQVRLAGEARSKGHLVVTPGQTHHASLQNRSAFSNNNDYRPGILPDPGARDLHRLGDGLGGDDSRSALPDLGVDLVNGLRGKLWNARARYLGITNAGDGVCEPLDTHPGHDTDSAGSATAFPSPATASL